jgi:3-(3-hydroxy-phenyl)propionate hydroxylase
MYSTESPSPQTLHDVLIVGAGPTGTALANLLCAQGLSVLVIERNVGVLNIPRAVHVDGETMRVFQTMGLGASLLDILRPGGRMQWVNAAGETLLVRTGVEGLGVHGWHNDYYFHQPQLEEALRRGLARFPGVELREGVEFRTLDIQPDFVDVQAWDLAADTPQSLRARYVVGCDGARSTVRRWVGAEDFEDLGEHQAWLVVDGVLNHPLDLPEHTVQHCDPGRPATSIYVQPLRRRWELMLLPGEDPQAMTETDTVWRLLAPWVKPAQARLERAATYMFHSLLAHRWQAGRVLLAGDAVHQTPPFLGQGLCAAIRDVANLGWKLAAALRLPACGETLLATYDQERKPHAREFIALAVELGRVIRVIDPAQAAARDARLKEQGLRFAFPSPSLGPGMHHGDGTGPIGRVFPQVELADSAWLDDHVGLRFALILDRDAPRPPASTMQRLERLGVVVILDGGPKAQQWLREHGCAAVCLRPDRYVFDARRSIDELPAVCDSLASWLGE